MSLAACGLSARKPAGQRLARAVRPSCSARALPAPFLLLPGPPALPFHPPGPQGHLHHLLHCVLRAWVHHGPEALRVGQHGAHLLPQLRVGGHGTAGARARGGGRLQWQGAMRMPGLPRAWGRQDGSFLFDSACKARPLLSTPHFQRSMAGLGKGGGLPPTSGTLGSAPTSPASGPAPRAWPASPTSAAASAAASPGRPASPASPPACPGPT